MWLKNLPTSKTQNQMASRVNSTKWLCCAVFSCSVSYDSAISQTVACQAPLSEEIPQARIVERGSLTSSRGSSQHRDQTQVFPIEGGFFTVWATMVKEEVICAPIIGDLNEIRKTQRDRVEREVEGGIRMGNTCISMADSCQCMTKTTTIL